MANTENTPRQTETEGMPASRQGHPLAALRDEVDRLFDNFFSAPFGRSMLDLDPFRRMGTAIRSWGDIAPKVDVKETEERLEITAELPGMAEEDVAVTVRDGILTITGEKKVERTEEKADYHLNERSYGAFTRAFRLPEVADEEGIAADFDKGVLTVTVPKRSRPEAQAKKIEVRKH